MGYITVFIIGCAEGYYLHGKSMRQLAVKNDEPVEKIRKIDTSVGMELNDRFFLVNLNDLYLEYNAKGLNELVNSIRKVTKLRFLRKLASMPTVDDVLDYYNSHEVVPLKVVNNMHSGDFILSSTLSERMDGLNIPSNLYGDDVEKMMNAYLNYYYASAVEDVINATKVPIEVLEKILTGESDVDKVELNKFRKTVESYLYMME